jgi:hypothetical protein
LHFGCASKSQLISILLPRTTQIEDSFYNINIAFWSIQVLGFGAGKAHPYSQKMFFLSNYKDAYFLQGKDLEPDANGIVQNVILKLLGPLRVAAALSDWCCEANPQLLERWEYSLEEYQKDMMEVFPWVSFSSMARQDSKTMIDRTQLIRQGRSVQLPGRMV